MQKPQETQIWSLHQEDQIQIPGDSQSLCWIPRLGSLMWCSEPSQQWENFFVIIVLPFVGHPPSRFGIWFYCDYAPPTISLKLLCLWTWGIFFLVDSSILLSLFVQQLVVILVLLQEEMSTHPSTLPSWTRSSGNGLYLGNIDNRTSSFWSWPGKNNQ